MEQPLPGQQNTLDAFIKTAQYLASLTTQQDVWSEIGKVLVNFFGADLAAFGERRADGEIVGRHWTFAVGVSCKGILTAETKEIIAEVLESGFLASQLIYAPDPYSLAFLPIMQANQTKAVMLVGHRMSEPLPKELLNVYLAVAGLAGTTITKLSAEEALWKSRSFLQSVIDGNTDLMMLIDRDYRILLANQAVRNTIEGKDPVTNCLACHQVSHHRDTPCEGGG